MEVSDRAAIVTIEKRQLPQTSWLYTSHYLVLKTSTPPSLIKAKDSKFNFKILVLLSKGEGIILIVSGRIR